MWLIDLKGNGKFLFEVLPHHFPEGFLTENEIALWELHFDAKKKL